MLTAADIRKKHEGIRTRLDDLRRYL